VGALDPHLVPQLSLHHVEDLGKALDRIARLLVENGTLILVGFAHERLSGATARWYQEQLRALAAVGRGAPVHLDRALDDVHTFSAMRRELASRFVERFFEWTPYLYRYELDEAIEPLERWLIELEAIQPTGFRYVGSPR